MSLIDFPINPSVGQTYSFGTKTWTWNGIGWIASGGGPTGPTGPNGTPGTGGATGPTGPVTLFSSGITNGKITESHASSAVTFALKDLAGNDPSGGSPVLLSFPNGSTVTVTSALSITIASTKTMGVPLNNTAFRIWIAIANNSGTAVMIVRNCTVPWQSTTLQANVRGFDPRGFINTTATPANAAQISYTPAGTTLVDTPYVVAAFASYESGLATVGTWDVSPTRITMVGLNTPLPGTAITRDYGVHSGQINTSSTTFATMWSPAFSVLDKCNVIKLHLVSDGESIGDGDVGQCAIFRNSDSTQLNVTTDFVYIDTVGKVMITQGGQIVQDYPAATGTVTYDVKAKASPAGTMAFPVSAAYMFMEEVMG